MISAVCRCPLSASRKRPKPLRAVLRHRPLQMVFGLGVAAASQCGWAQGVPEPTRSATGAAGAPISASGTVTNATNTTNATQQALPGVSVSASALTDTPLHLKTPVAAGALGARSQLDTPFSTTVVTSEDIADRQANKLGDVFAGDASVTDQSNAYSAYATAISIRGLAVDWEYGFKIDGMPFNSYGITMPYENLERVELLKGLSGFMYGFAQPGGAVNYVTKKPGADPVTSFDVGYRMNGVFSEHTDLSRRFGRDGMFGARLNYYHDAGRTYNNGKINRNALALSLDGQLTRNLDVYANVLYQQSRSSGQTPAIYTGGYTASSLPSAISGGNARLGGTDQHINTNMQLYTAGVRYKITPDWTFDTSASYSTSARDRNESTLSLLDYNGDYRDSRWNGDEAHQNLFWQGMFQGKVRTGPFTHDLIVGASYQNQNNYYAPNAISLALGSGNLYQSNLLRYYSGSNLSTYRASDITQKALFLSDTLQLTSRWSLLAGVRYTNYSQNAYATTGVRSSSYSQSGVVTPTLAVMYKIDPVTTLYASYVESLEQGTSVSTIYANAGALLRPMRSRQYETGIKSEHARWSANAALFRVERGAGYANSQNVYVQDGDSIYQGLEAGGSVRLGRQWKVTSDIMLLDSWYAKGQAYKGNRVAGAPKFAAAARLTYDVPVVHGLQLGIDAKYTGNQTVRPAGGLQTSSYTLVNMGATYMTRIGKRDVTLRAAVNNVTNRRYWLWQYADYIAPGEPRTISLNAKIDF